MLIIYEYISKIRESSWLCHLSDAKKQKAKYAGLSIEAERV